MINPNTTDRLNELLVQINKEDQEDIRAFLDSLTSVEEALCTAEDTLKDLRKEAKETPESFPDVAKMYLNILSPLCHSFDKAKRSIIRYLVKLIRRGGGQ